MDKYAFINTRGELKITYNMATAKIYKYVTTDVEIYRGNDRNGGYGEENDDGSYFAAIVTGNPEINGKELFVDRDGIRVDDAEGKTIPHKKYPKIQELYAKLN